MPRITQDGNRYLLGKYRGVVFDNEDPDQLGRLLVQIPSIWGDQEHHAWAEPNFPSVELFTVPPIGSQIWVEFEEGDPDQPIWTGCMLKESEPHTEAKDGSPKVRSWKTEEALRISLDDNEKEIQIHVGDTTKIIIKQTDNKIIIDAEAIEIGEGGTHPIMFGDNLMSIFNDHTHVVDGSTEDSGGATHSHLVEITSAVPGSTLSAADMSAKHKVE